MRFPSPALVLLAPSLALAIAGCAARPSAASGIAGAPLTFERIYASEELALESLAPIVWLPDGSGYWTIEESGADGGSEIVRYDAASGSREVVVSASELVPEGAGEPLAVEEFQVSDDGRHVLVFTNTRKVWRVNTRGDYWLLDRESGALRRLGQEFEEASLMYAKLSPDGSRVAYVHANDLYAEDVAAPHVVRLTQGGSETLIHGNADWVYEEEFSVYDGFRWSPDGQRIAFWQFDAAEVGLFHLVDDLAGLYPRLVPIRYPKVGTANSACRIGIVEAEGGDVTWLALEGDPSEHYVARLEWAASSEEVVIQRLDRRQQRLDVMLGDASTGAVRSVLLETDQAWVEVVDELEWLAGGARFTWISERDGWRHVWLGERSGAAPRLVTPGDYDVAELIAVDEAGGWIYFTASPANPTQRFLHRARLDGSGAPERVTPAGVGGLHAYDIAPGARWAVHSWSAAGEPPRSELVRLPGHESVRALVENERLRAAHAGLSRTPVEFFRVDVGGGVELDGWCIKPPDFDASKRWPVLFNVYGEPWNQTVLDAWSGNYLWHLLLAQRGYVVMSVDNRGTPAPRGREWRKCIYGQIGVLASRDQADAVLALQERWPWMDPERTAIWGWSGGGSMTLNALLRYPEIYEVGMSVAPVPDLRLYDTIYQERYMGLLADNPDGYRLGSPITFAGRLAGDLLLVHGSGDDNVHYQGTQKLIDTLVAAGKPFSLMVYPGRSHSIDEGEGTRRHLFELLTRFLEQNLPAGPGNTVP
jgi:dipeptidyl-peptidase-4